MMRDVSSDIYFCIMIRDFFIFWVIVSFVHSDDKEKKMNMTGRIVRQLNFPLDMFITSIYKKKNDKDLSFFIIIG